MMIGDAGTIYSHNERPVQDSKKTGYPQITPITQIFQNFIGAYLRNMRIVCWRDAPFFAAGKASKIQSIRL